MSGLWRRARRVLGALAGVALGAAALVALTSGPATASGPGCSGATNEVITNTDAALRAAFLTASGGVVPQTICIDSGLGTITLGGTELSYTAVPGLTVQGNGITISGNNASRVVDSAAPLTLNGVTITGGHAVTGVGGVSANGNVTLINSTISGNTAIGAGDGGVSANGNVTLTNSTVSGNTATTGGTGGVSANGNVTLTNSTISGNTATATGSGGVSANGDVTLTNSTVSGNTAIGAGDGGGGVFANGNVTLVYATVVQNSAPIGANVDATVGLTSFGSVVAQAKGGGANCVVASHTSNGFNFSDDASAGVSCHFNAATDRVGASNDPMLGALGANGGPTNTMVPNPGSALIDAIPDPGGGCPAAPTITTDQRSLPRPSGPGCDIGAVEVQIAAPAPAPVMITPKFTG